MRFVRRTTMGKIEEIVRQRRSEARLKKVMED